MARRDRSAWAAMYDRHVGDVFGVIHHLLGGDAATAEDVNQEVWLLAIEQFDRFDPSRGAFRDWLLGIARHCAFRRLRPSSRLVTSNHPDGPSSVLPPPDLLEEVERADAVRAALLCLDADHRRVLMDKYVAGLTVQEIAERIGRSAKAVESLLSRARARLRALLAPYFSTTTGGECHEPRDIHLGS